MTLFLAALASPVYGQTTSASAPTAPPPAPRGRNFLISRDVPDLALVERGQKLFVAQCGFCHGSNANGGETGPDLIRSALALNDEGGDKVGPVILAGRPEKGMPGFKLTESQIKDVAAFLRARQQAAIDRGSYVILDIVTGDPKKGQEYFATHCASCHSETGDLAGVAAKYDPVALQARFLYPQQRFGGRRGAGGQAGGGPGGAGPGGAARPLGDRPSSAPAVARTAGIPQVTVVTPTGETLTGTLEYIDDFDVRFRDSSGTTRSFPRVDNLKLQVHDPLAAHEALLKQYTNADMHNILAYLETLK